MSVIKTKQRTVHVLVLYVIAFPTPATFTLPIGERKKLAPISHEYFMARKKRSDRARHHHHPPRAVPLCAAGWWQRLRIASGPSRRIRGGRILNITRQRANPPPPLLLSFLIRALISYLVSLYLVLTPGDVQTHTHKTHRSVIWRKPRPSDSKRTKDCRRCCCNHSPEFLDDEVSHFPSSSPADCHIRQY